MSISSAESIASNDDLLIDILLRLPLKSLAQYKSVSAHWRSLISTTPQFSSPKPVHALLLQRSHHVHDLELLPLDHTSTTCLLPFRSLTFLPEDSLLRVSSCNGLLLCHEARKQEITYHVYNPTTNHDTRLPPLPKVHNLRDFSGYIAFEPSISQHYKVISFHLISVHSCEISIYSSETRHWRAHDEDASRTTQLYGLYLNLRKGVFWNGAIHWIDRGKSLIFDTRGEKWQETQTSFIGRYPKLGFDYLGVSWGHLYLIMCNEIYHKHLRIYEMESESFRWRLRYEVEIGHELTTLFPEMVPRNNGNYHLYHIPFFGQPPSVGEEPYLVLQIKSQLVCYYFRTRTVGKIYDLPPSVVDGRTVPLAGAHQYIESLLCI